MDRYYLDSEFIDDGKTIDLISIGIVCSDGRELYLQSCEFDLGKASAWVQNNVFPHLALCSHLPVYAGGEKHVAPNLFAHRTRGQCTFSDGIVMIGAHTDCYWRTRQQMMREVKTFFNPSDGFELWGWCAGYDFVALCQLFGTMMDAPLNWPHYIKDIQYVLDNQGISDDELPPQKEGLHNALADARYIKRLWERLHVQEVNQ